MGVSIFYTAVRKRPISSAEDAAIKWAVAQFPFESLMRECGLPEAEFSGESFCIYQCDEFTEPGVVLEGAMKLPGCNDEAPWIAIRYWCRLLSEIRKILYDADWRVHVEDSVILWDVKRQAYIPWDED